jgi:hypothetical protein
METGAVLAAAFHFWRAMTALRKWRGQIRRAMTALQK